MAEITRRNQTAARIGLGNTGCSIPIKADLEFRLAHAMARDAVYSEMLPHELLDGLVKMGIYGIGLKTEAPDRTTYLKRPDLGRQLPPQELEKLKAMDRPADLVIVVADGLSAHGVRKYALPLIERLLPVLKQRQITMAPVCVVEQGRVAIGDDIGQALNARMTVVLIGERPGLSAADSMGIYITYGPHRGCTDDRRNCISNVRDQGLPVAAACDKLNFLLAESFRLGVSGIQLKDISEGSIDAPSDL